MDYQIWLNGEYVARDEAKISARDRGFKSADLAFDTSRTFDGKVFRLRAHLDRFYRSLKYMRLDPRMTIEEMERITLEVCERNESVREAGDDYMVTQIVTRGVGGTPAQPNDSTVMIWIDPIEFDRYAPLMESGAHVVIPKTRSYTSDQVDPKVKSYNRLNFVMASLETADVDPDAFPVLLDTDGNISEGIGYNFMVVTDGVIRTAPDSNILQGVSRQTIFDLAAQLGIPTSEEVLQPYDAYTADEAIISTTPYCLLPVGRIDNRQIGDEVPGPVTRQLLAAWSELAGLDIVDQMTQRAKVLQSRRQ